MARALCGVLMSVLPDRANKAPSRVAASSRFRACSGGVRQPACPAALRAGLRALEATLLSLGHCVSNPVLTMSFSSLLCPAGNIRTLVPLDAESRIHYWLTVVASDHGVVPLSSRLEVYVGVEDVNDNAPLTLQAAYRGEVAENSPAGKWVAEIRAKDRDVTAGRLTFRITGGNPENFFTINPDTGKWGRTEAPLGRTAVLPPSKSLAGFNKGKNHNGRLSEKFTSL